MSNTTTTSTQDERLALSELEAVFAYMLVRLAEKYAENVLTENLNIDISNFSLKQKLDFFNGGNNFTKSKILVFPYIITIGNGHKQELLDFFKNFYPFQVGFIHKEIRTKIDSNSFDSVFKIENDKFYFVKSFLTDINDNNILDKLCTQSTIRDKKNIETICTYIVDSINHIQIAIPYFMNKIESSIVGISKNSVYNKCNYYFDKNENFTSEIEGDTEDAVLKYINKLIIETHSDLEPTSIIKTVPSTKTA